MKTCILLDVHVPRLVKHTLVSTATGRSTGQVDIDVRALLPLTADAGQLSACTMGLLAPWLVCWAMLCSSKAVRICVR